MSQLRNGEVKFGKGKQKTKYLNNIENVDVVKQKVKIVLNYFSIDAKSAETQELALDKHIDNMNAHADTHTQLNELLNKLDPTQLANTVASMPNETDEQKYGLVTACRKVVRQLQNVIADNRPGADQYAAEQKQNRHQKTIDLSDLANGSVDGQTQGKTLEDLNKESETIDAKKKIINIAKAELRKEENKKILNQKNKQNVKHLQLKTKPKSPKLTLPPQVQRILKLKSNKLNLRNKLLNKWRNHIKKSKLLNKLMNHVKKSKLLNKQRSLNKKRNRTTPKNMSKSLRNQSVAMSVVI